MPKVTNKKTGKSKTVTAEEMKAIQENEIMGPLYNYSEPAEPEEVTEEKARKAGTGKPADSNEARSRGLGNKKGHNKNADTSAGDTGTEEGNVVADDTVADITPE